MSCIYCAKPTCVSDAVCRSCGRPLRSDLHRAALDRSVVPGAVERSAGPGVVAWTLALVGIGVIASAAVFLLRHASTVVEAPAPIPIEEPSEVRVHPSPSIEPPHRVEPPRAEIAAPRTAPRQASKTRNTPAVVPRKRTPPVVTASAPSQRPANASTQPIVVPAGKPPAPPAPAESPRRVQSPWFEGRSEVEVRERLGQPKLTQRDPKGVTTWYYDASRGTLKVYFYNGIAHAAYPWDAPAIEAEEAAAQFADALESVEGLSTAEVRELLGSPSLQQTDADRITTWYYDTPRGTRRVFFLNDRAYLKRPR